MKGAYTKMLIVFFSGLWDYGGFFPLWFSVFPNCAAVSMLLFKMKIIFFMNVLLVVTLNKYQLTAEDRYTRVHGDMSTYKEQTTHTACVCKGLDVL